jgi:hypothetical protein
MGRKESYKEPLLVLIDESLRTGVAEKLVNYLTSNSNLPGPRGNLELADAFADVVGGYEGDCDELWSLCMRLSRLSLVEAPVNNPREFLVFCGARGVGALGASPRFFQKALSRLKELASDARWRTREGVAMALQSMITMQPQKTLKELERWVEGNNWLVMRAVAAGVAEPVLLKDEETAHAAFELHKQILARIAVAGEPKSSEFKTLRQGLGYSLSVIAREVPEEGFAYMRQLASQKDADILWIVKENLKKNRLLKNFPEEVAATKKLLG